MFHSLALTSTLKPLTTKPCIDPSRSVSTLIALRFTINCAKANAKCKIHNAKFEPPSEEGGGCRRQTEGETVCKQTICQGKCKIQNSKCIKPVGAIHESTVFCGSIVIDPYTPPFLSICAIALDMFASQTRMKKGRKKSFLFFH